MGASSDTHEPDTYPETPATDWLGSALMDGQHNGQLLELFRQAPSAICILSGPSHRFQFANDAYLQFVGDRDVLGKTVREVLPEIEGQGFLELLDKVYRTNTPFTGLEVPVGLRAHPESPLDQRYVDFAYQPIRDPLGKVVGIFVNGFDVTDRIRSQENLRATETRLARELSDARTLQKVSGALLLEQHIESLYTGILDAAMELMKSDFASIQMLIPGTNELYLLASRNFHPLSRDFWQKVDAGSGSTCGQALLENRRIVAPDLEKYKSALGTRDMEEYRRSGIRACQSTPLVSRSGQPLGMISTHWSQPHQPDESDFALFDVLVRQAADLVERTKAEEALRASKTQLSLSLEASSMGTFIWHPQEDKGVPDKRMLALFGLSPDSELSLATATSTLVHLHDRQRYANAVARSLDPAGDGRLREDIRVCWPDSSQHWLAITAQTHFEGDPPRAVRMAGMAVDITARKKTEAALVLASAESSMWQRLYQAVLANTPDLGYVFDLNHRFTYANDALLKMWGRTWENAIGKNCLELGYPSWHAAMHDRELDYVVANKKPIRGEVPFTGTNGRRVYDYIFFPVLDSDGQVEAVGGTTRDITDIRVAESALRESEERFRLFVDNVREYALVQTDLGFCITSWNPGAERMFGYRSQEVLGKSFAMLVSHEDLEADILGKELDRVSEMGRNEDARWFTRKDGSRLWTRWVTEPVRDESGSVLGLAKVLRDETERQRLENTARQSEKLAVVGRLASSIAHEINNPLEAVTNLIYLARQAAVSPETTQYLDQAESELRRVSHIAIETLKFHRQSSLPALTDVVELIESVLTLHEGRIRESQIAILRSYRPHPLITCLPSEIRQVLANLIGNAIDAMAQSNVRRLLVRVQRSSNPRTSEPGVSILIADTGTGINRAARPHLFEPFFTTKESTGTGLGLWVSAEIVRRHHGTLRFRSGRIGTRQGTVFSLFLTERLHAAPAEPVRADSN